MFLEAMLCIKNGRELFGRTQATNIIVWLLGQWLCSVVCVSGCVLWHKYYQVCSVLYLNNTVYCTLIVCTVQ
jgi:phosphatidylserine synthase 1